MSDSKPPESPTPGSLSAQQRTRNVTFEATQISYRSGLLPEPSELAAYNNVIPNGADRIMKMAEAQSAHRIELERTVVTSQQAQEKRGQWFGLVIAIFFASCGTWAALNGEPWFGGVIVNTTLIGLVGLFVYSKHQAKKELSAKRQGTMIPPAPPHSPNPPRPPQHQKRRK